MKKSPLQLKWITYPAASFEYLEGKEAVDDPISVEVSGEVRWDIDRDHSVYLSIKSKDGGDAPYRFSATAVANFSFDLSEATKHYDPTTAMSLPGMIAVNVARILYSSAREQISIMTARGPAGEAVIETIIIEPRDLVISSNAEPPKILREIFGVSEETLDLLEKAAKSKKKSMKKKKSP
jgi:hypothetical protein